MPTAPVSWMASSNEKTIRFRWLAPVDQALAITGYRVYVDKELVYDGSHDSGTLDYTLNNCTIGQVYWMQVAAVNLGGETIDPPIVNTVCARRPYKPDPPVILSVNCTRDPVLPAKNNITIGYKEPEDTGGLPLSGWRVQRADGDSMVFRTIGPFNPFEEDITEYLDDDTRDGCEPGMDPPACAGLTFGQTYKYRVVATAGIQNSYFNIYGIDAFNSTDASDWTTVVCKTPTILAPEWIVRDIPPVSRTAITLSWEQVNVSTDLDASDVSGYILYGGREDDGVFDLIYNGSSRPDVLSFTHENLEPGVRYQYKVAVSVIPTLQRAEQPRSDAFVFTAALAAEQPQGPVLLAAGRSWLHVGWAPPRSDGGSPVLGYAVRWSGGVANSSEDTSADPLQLDFVLSDLSPDTEISVQVLAITSTGYGAPTEVAVFRTLSEVPPLPFNQSALAVSGASALEQEAASAALGLACAVALGPDSGMLHTVRGIGHDSTCGRATDELASLLFGAPSAVAFSSLGAESGRESSALAPLIIGLSPRLPADLTVATDSVEPSVLLSWKSAAEVGNKVPTRAIVIQRDVALGGKAWQVLAALPASATQYNDTNVSVGETYKYRLLAASEAGASLWSSVVHVPHVASVPAAVASVDRWAFEDGELTLGWAEVETNGARVYQYSLFMASVEGGPFTLVASGPDNNATIADLTPERWYYFYATAQNSAGSSPPSPVAVIGTFSEPTAPSRPWLLFTSCAVDGRGDTATACTDWANATGVKACAMIEWRPQGADSARCPVLGYRVLRNGEVVQGLLPVGTHSLLDVYGQDFDCFSSVRVMGNDVQGRQVYTVQALNCIGWSLESEALSVPVTAPPAKVCGEWSRADPSGDYECTSAGLAASPLNDTSLKFEWTLLQDVALVPNDDGVDLAAQLIGSTDPNTLLGYELFLDDGRGGPFTLAFNGTGKPLKNVTEVHDLVPGLGYRAFVRAVARTGFGDASDTLKAWMVMPPAAPINVTKEYYGTKQVIISWTPVESVYDEVRANVPVLGFVLERAMEPGYDEWYENSNSPADNLDTSQVFTLLEPDQRFAFRVRAWNVNGEGNNSAIITKWVGNLPAGSPENLRRVESAEGVLAFGWDWPSDAELLGISRVQSFEDEWGYRAYLWESGQEAATLVYDGYGAPSTLEFSVVSATCGGVYEVAMAFVTPIGEGPLSDRLRTTLASLPDEIQSLAVTGTTEFSVSLSWGFPAFTGCVEIYCYRVWRYDPSTISWADLGYTPAAANASSAVREFTDSGLSAGTKYYYKVQACVVGTYAYPADLTLELADPPARPLGCGGLSDPVAVYAAQAPGPPEDVRLGPAEGTELELTWSPPGSDGMGGNAKLEYDVDVDGGGGFARAGSTDTASFRLTGLQLGIHYRIRVWARNDAGHSVDAPLVVYQASELAETPEAPVTLSLTEPVGNAFSAHPALASTPSASEVSLAFAATEPSGFGWAIIVRPDAAADMNYSLVKQGWGAVGGAGCKIMGEAIGSGRTSWQLGSEGDPDSPEGCLLEYESLYFAFVYVEGPSGDLAGTLSGGVPVLTPIGRSNTFSAVPYLSCP
ncbi:unnamed protein product, partial [Prorocentrum cordatum]